MWEGNGWCLRVLQGFEQYGGLSSTITVLSDVIPNAPKAGEGPYVSTHYDCGKQDRHRSVQGRLALPPPRTAAAFMPFERCFYSFTSQAKASSRVLKTGNWRWEKLLKVSQKPCGNFSQRAHADFLT
jgi:hypothetical protein